MAMAANRRTEGPGFARRILEPPILARASRSRSTPLDRGSSRRIVVMRYPTRAYQNDHRRRRRNSVCRLTAIAPSNQ